ncbi:MAG TPA: outer membrane beta-barrel protein [Candidatus Binataceae bacterium]|nr:outer membrane beta-barrel protein [Candidatus Binataceae bacterium]
MTGWLTRISGAAISALVTGVAIANVASAQIIPTPEATIPERQSVLQRPHPEYDALGIRAGSFLILPSADVIESWDSNIYATPTRDSTDMVTTVQPQVGVQSDWNNHALNFFIGDQSKIYASHGTENVNNLTAAAQGRLDVLRDVYFTGGGGYQLNHEDRSSPNATVSGKFPTETHLVDGNLGFVHETGKIGLRLNSAVDSYSYNNNVTNTGSVIQEKYRDYISYSFVPRLSYEIVPGYSAFVQTPVNEHQYVSRDLQGFSHSSHGYEGDAGVALHLASAVNGEIFGGYLRQEFEDHHLSNAQGIGGGANLLWNVTDLTSLRLAVSRTVQETDVVGASSYLETTGKLAVEHELLPNVLLTASGTYFVDSFKGLNRSDNNYNAYAGVKYLMNRTLSVGFEANYWHRDSNTPGVNYDREIIGLRLRAQL